MIITTKNLHTPDTEIFNSDSIKFEIGERDTKAARNQNTDEKYSCSIIIPKAINIKNNPNIHKLSHLTLFLMVLFESFVYPSSIFFNI